MTDAELVARFQRGEDDAFEELVERHKREVYMLSYRLAGNHADAHDISQEAFIRVYQGLKRFRGESAFRTWLYRVVMNVGLNQVRKLQGWNRRTLELDRATDVGETPDLAARIDERAQRARVSGAIQGLPPRQRETVILKVYQELRFSDIAGIMSCSVGTAKANYFHALANLRRALAEPGGTREPV